MTSTMAYPIIDVFKKMRDSLIDYAAVKRNCYYNFDKSGKEDIVVIIPVRGRTEFSPVTIKEMNNAIGHTGLNISITVIEHSGNPQHKKICEGKTNYIWLPANDITGYEFNKCLAHNVAALFNTDTKYYLFHDVDILVPNNFFNALWDNIKTFNAIQTFAGRRLLQLSESVTRNILYNDLDPTYLTAPHPEIKECQPGASGGSILVDCDLFYRVGGFDPELFTEYSVEDQFFFDKLMISGAIGFCNNPPIELLHLYHAPSFNQETKPQDWAAFNSFHRLSPEEKKLFMSEKARYLCRFI